VLLCSQPSSRQLACSLSLDFLPHPVRLVSPIGSLILVRPTNSTFLQLAICNLFSRQFKQLPLLNIARTNPVISVLVWFPCFIVYTQYPPNRSTSQYPLGVVSATPLGTKGWLGRPHGPKGLAETTAKTPLGVASATPLALWGWPSHHSFFFLFFFFFEKYFFN
jgi:hypothetical protein